MDEAALDQLLAAPVLGDGGTYADLLRHMSTYDADLLAIEWSGGAISYGELLRTVAAEAEYLTSVGVGRGDVVASMVTAHPYSLANHLAVGLIGALSAPVYIETTGEVLAKTLNSLRAKVVMAMPAAVPSVNEILDDVPTLERVVPTLDSDFDTMMRAGRDIAPWLETSHPARTDPCMLISTSGTTGPPKPVIFPHVAASYGYVMSAKWQLQQPLKVYITTSWGHGAVTWQFPIAFWFGGSVVLPDRFSASGFWDDVRRYKCTAALLFGPMLRAVFNKMEDAGAEIPIGLDFNLMTAGCPIDIWHRLTEAAIRIYEIYSCTEANSAPDDTCMLLSNPNGRYRPGSVGRPWVEHEARIIDDEGNLVAEGEVGELQMKPIGRAAVVRYFNNPAAAEELIVDGWVKTGDYFYQEGGDYFFVSRKRDIIRRRGINMSPGSIDEQLTKHAAVETAVTFAVPSDLGEDDIKVVIVPADGHDLSPQHLAKITHEHLPRHMRPRYIEVVASIPVTPGNGRPQREQMKRAWKTASTWDTEAERYLQPESSPDSITR